MNRVADSRRDVCCKSVLLIVGLVISTGLSELCGQSTDAGSQRVDHRDLTWFLDSSGKTQPVRTQDDWALRRTQILAGMQEAMGAFPSPDRVPDFDIQVTEDVRIQDVRRLTLSIAVETSGATQNARLPLDLYFPAALANSVDPSAILSLKSEHSVPAMLALHPTGPAGKRIVAGEGPRGNRQYGLELARRGYITICPDYPSFGDSANYDFAADAYASGTMKGIINHMRCIDLLCAIPCVDDSRIGAIGHSLGGHNAMFTAVFDARIQITVSSCGWTPFHDYYGGKIAGWTSDRYMPLLKEKYDLNPDLVPFDFQEVVAALAPRTFVSISPLHDDNFDVEGVKRAIPRASGIYNLLGAKDELILVTPDCEHDFPADMRERAYREIDRKLKHVPPSNLEPDYSGELPRIAAHEPADALKTFDVLPGFHLEQTAAEPVVVDPVAMSFDEEGRLFVVEMRDYSEQADEKLGRVRVLLDDDRDGRYESSHVYADGLSWPTAVICFDGGVFVGAPPHVYYLKDNDGDFQAEQKKIVFTGFGRSNVQGLMNCFHWGPDNRIYGQTSSSGATVTFPEQPDKPAVDLRSRDFSFDPRSLDLRPETGGAQHGMCFDDWGNRYVCSNSDHAQAIVFDDRYLNRNPLVSAAAARVSIAVDGGQAPVFRTSPVEPWRIVRTRLRASGVVKGLVEGGGRPAGYFTGSTGLNVYRGDAWPESMKGTLIVADVGSNIVHRKKSEPDGVIWKASRIDPERELVASNDIWFRPVQFANAPDGCLHILDMYREVIEHPASLPPEIKKHLDLTSGRDRGRLYRIVPDGHTPRAFASLGQMTTAELVETLSHPNGWHRDTASRLLYERQDPITADLLRKAFAAAPPVGRIHILGALEGQRAVNEGDIIPALKDPNPRVRERALRLAERFAVSEIVGSALSAMQMDEDARVRLQLAFTLGEFAPELRQPILEQMLIRDGQDRWIRTAVLTSLNDGMGAAMKTLASAPELTAQPAVQATLADVTELVARQGGTASLTDILPVIQGLKQQTALKLDLVRRVSRVIPTAGTDAGFAELTGAMIAEGRRTAMDETAPLPVRTAGLEALTLSRFSEDGERLLELLTPATPPDVQLTVVESLGSFPDVEVANALIPRMGSMSPKVMERTRELLLSRTEWISVLLEAVRQKQLMANAVPFAELQRLAGHPDPKVREIAAELLASTGTSSREEVIRTYQQSLSLVGNEQRGAAVFQKHCSVCHQLNGVGHQVGPNLATVTNRGPEAILVNVLDPNREVNPAWKEYVAVTQAGNTHNGVIIAETGTSITLRRSEAKEDTLLRTDIEELRETGRSLMPEGIEKQVDVQSMADLLSWLMIQK
ncbi:MAG: alpha/beta fold hydrolase [Planctomyces sp.]|nr:alpha/beta fold hydrolase [Planctomyces sp.]